MNNGISIEKDSEVLRELIIGNVMADLIADAYADAVINIGLV